MSEPSDQGKPAVAASARKEMPSDEKQAWTALGVPWAEVIAISEQTGIKLLSQRLEAITREVNRNLFAGGFEYQLTCYQTLGVFFNQFCLSRLGRSFSVFDVAVHYIAEQQLRQELKLDRREKINSELLNQRVKELVGVAAAKLKELKAQKPSMPVLPTVDVTKVKPVLAKSIKDLILLEAKVQTARALGLPSKAALPPEAEPKFREQVTVAWKKYCDMHGIDPVPTLPFLF